MNKKQLIETLEKSLRLLAQNDPDLFEEMCDMIDGLYYEFLIKPDLEEEPEKDDDTHMKFMFYADDKELLNRLFTSNTNNFKSDFNLYEEKQLSFAKVIEGLKEGKKFKRLSWLNQYIFLGNFLFPSNKQPSKIIVSTQNQVSNKYNVSDDDLLADDWIEVN